jgi:hypothetical protein
MFLSDMNGQEIIDKGEKNGILVVPFGDENRQ